MGRNLVALVMAGCMMLSLFTAVAGAQDKFEVPRLFGVFAPKQGVWSEYAIFDKATGRRTVMRMSTERSGSLLVTVKSVVRLKPLRSTSK